MVPGHTWEVLVVTEREHFCEWVQQTRHKIEFLPVLTQICDPPILHVLPDVLTYILDTVMHWWHGKFSVHVSSDQSSLLNRIILWKTPHVWVCTLSNNVPVVNSHLEMVVLNIRFSHYSLNHTHRDNCLCTCEDRTSSPTLTVFVNFQTLSTIINRPSKIKSYQQLVDK